MYSLNPSDSFRMHLNIVSVLFIAVIPTHLNFLTLVCVLFVLYL